MVTCLTLTFQAWPLLGFLKAEATAFPAESWKPPCRVGLYPHRALQLRQSASQPGEPFARWAFNMAGW